MQLQLPDSENLLYIKAAVFTTLVWLLNLFMDTANKYEPNIKTITTYFYAIVVFYSVYKILKGEHTKRKERRKQ